MWRNDGGNRHTSLRVRVEARVSNRSGVGAKVELRGSLRQVIETSAASPPVAADVVFGLGSRTAADAIRVLWPSGILQAETALYVPAADRAPESITVTELNREPYVVPVPLHVEQHVEFVTDFMGGGEMGGWAGRRPGTSPIPTTLRINGDRLQPRDGRYQLRSRTSSRRRCSSIGCSSSRPITRQISRSSPTRVCDGRRRVRPDLHAGCTPGACGQRARP